MLHSLTDVINSVALLVALWLGMYVVTRSPRQPEAWLSALASWSLSGNFLNQLLALSPPPANPPETRIWLDRLLLFWPHDVFELGWKGWLQGWLPAWGIVFWYHATLHMVGGVVTLRRLSGAVLGYAYTLVSILLQVQYVSARPDLFVDPLYSSALTYPFYPLFAAGIVVFAGLSVLNLMRTARSSPIFMPQIRLWLFVGACFAVGVTGLLGLCVTVLNIPIPQALIALLLLAALLVAGVGITNRATLTGQRLISRDFLYSATGAAAVLAVYLLFLLIVSGLYPIPEVTFISVACLALISHSLIDIARRTLDTLYLYNQSQKLHLRLHELYDLVGKRETGDVLVMALETLASAAKTAWALVLRRAPQGLELLASWNWRDVPLQAMAAALASGNLPTNRLAVLERHQLAPPLDQAAVAFPLPDHEQHGLLLVGPSRGRLYYSEADLETIQDVGDFIAGLIMGRTPAGLAELSPYSSIDGILGQQSRKGAAQKGAIAVGDVKLALRHLNNYAQLADSPLSRLHMVTRCMDGFQTGTATYMDRGRAVADVLSEAVSKLRPSQGDMPNPPPRGWYPYLVLRDAYLEGKPNLEIMMRLYISEGTFNRTRKVAIQSVARIWAEMEAQVTQAAQTAG